MPPKKIRYQLGGARGKGKDRKIYVIPVVDGVQQLGGAFWSSAWKWTKDAAKKVANAAQPFIKPLHKMVKDSGVVSAAASALPGIGPAAGYMARQYGYGRASASVQKGNAMKAAR